jgi:hypothetical protein
MAPSSVSRTLRLNAARHLAVENRLTRMAAMPAASFGCSCSGKVMITRESATSSCPSAALRCYLPTVSLRYGDGQGARPLLGRNLSPTPPPRAGG